MMIKNLNFISLFTYKFQHINEVLALSEEMWLKNIYRQQTYQTHNQTHSLIYRWTNDEVNFLDTIETLVSENSSDPLEHEVWQLAEQCRKFFTHNNENSIITKLMLARLGPNKIIPIHCDSGQNLEKVHRCHFPIVTDERCRFYINDVDYFFDTGTVIEINNTKPHGVFNRSGVARIHLMIDIYNPIDAEKIS